MKYYVVVLSSLLFDVRIKPEVPFVMLFNQSSSKQFLPGLHIVYCILYTSPAHLNHSLNSRSFYAAGAAAAVCGSCAVTLITADTRASPSPAHKIASAKFADTSENSREHFSLQGSLYVAFFLRSPL